VIVAWRGCGVEEVPSLCETVIHCMGGNLYKKSSSWCDCGSFSGLMVANN
jgi:hypothetical protein